MVIGAQGGLQASAHYCPEAGGKVGIHIQTEGFLRFSPAVGLRMSDTPAGFVLVDWQRLAGRKSAVEMRLTGPQRPDLSCERKLLVKFVNLQAKRFEGRELCL